MATSTTTDQPEQLVFKQREHTLRDILDAAKRMYPDVDESDLTIRGPYYTNEGRDLLIVEKITFFGFEQLRSELVIPARRTLRQLRQHAEAIQSRNFEKTKFAIPYGRPSEFVLYRD